MSRTLQSCNQPVTVVSLLCFLLPTALNMSLSHLSILGASVGKQQITCLFNSQLSSPRGTISGSGSDLLAITQKSQTQRSAYLLDGALRMVSVQEKGVKDGKCHRCLLSSLCFCVSLYFSVPCRRLSPCTSYGNGLPCQEQQSCVNSPCSLIKIMEPENIG